MSVSRRHVFVEKVLKRLFPNVPSGQEKETPQLLPLETPFRKTISEKVEHKRIHHLTDGDIKIQPERRLYTVSLPPEGYVPCLPEPSSRTDSESASSGPDAEGVARDADSAVSAESAKELLTCLESRSMSPSDVSILDHMRTLLLLQDTERLEHALEMFPEHCMMPPDHARVISAFFNYWITHIFPEKDSE
ncbi:glutamate-rich protein 1 isoform X3 [Urocitellus parryii]